MVRGKVSFLNHNCTIEHKRHGRSSGMRHGWRSASPGVRTPVCLSVQWPVRKVPASAPFSIPLHHRYRRWTGGVSRPRSLFAHMSMCPAESGISSRKKKARHPAQHTCTVPSVAGTAGYPVAHVLLIFLFYLPGEEGRELTSSRQQSAAQPLRLAIKNQDLEPLDIIKSNIFGGS